MTRRSGPFHERGQILVFTVVSLVGLLGIAALSIDAAFMYDKRNRLYAAADAAAKSAAFAYRKNASSDLQKFGEHEVEVMGLTPIVACNAAGGTSVCMNRPPTSGPYAGNGNYVEAIVSQRDTGTFFGAVLGWLSASPGARAVAGLGNPNDCVIINDDLTMGNFQFVLNGCGVSVGGDLNGTNPNAAVTDSSGNYTPPVNVVGDCSNYCSKMGDLNLDAAAPADPLADKLTAVSPPANPAACTGTGSLTTIGPGCYNNIGPSVRTLQAGEYYITGTVNIDDLSGEDVFLYLAAGSECPDCGGPGGRLNVIGQNKRLHLRAPSSGTYQGIAVWQNIADTFPFSCVGCPPAGDPFPPNNFTLEWSGAIYMPGVTQEFRNHANFVPLDGCALFIAKSLTVSNGSGGMMNTNCANQFGNAAFLSITVAE